MKLKDAIPLEKFAARQVGLWQRSCESGKSTTITTVLPTITISKEMGSLGVELAARISDRLQWPYFDKDLVESISSNAQVRSTIVEIFDERVQNEIHDFVTAFLNRHALSNDKYFRHLVTVVKALARNGKVIIVGRGGNFIITPEFSLRIKVSAPMKNRVTYLMNRDSLSKGEAEHIIRKADQERAVFIQRLFRHNFDDPLYYDLVLNTEFLTMKAAEEIVLNALQAKFPDLYLL